MGKRTSEPFVPKPKKSFISKLREASTIISIVLGICSFIPLVGVLLGFGAIAFGFVAVTERGNKKGLIGIVLGVGGILFTVAVYGGLFYFGFIKRGGIYDEMRAEMTRSLILDAVNSIEAYKVRFGEYPDRLSDLQNLSGSPLIWTDPTQMVPTFSLESSSSYYYKKVPKGYCFFSKGPDRVPYTDDDIHPPLEGNLGGFGYLEPSKCPFETNLTTV